MSYTYEITTAGKALIAKAQTGTTIDFTKAELGKGELTTELPAEFTSLLDLVPTNVIIQQKEYIEGAEEAKISLTYNNETLSEGFYVREIGLYADDPDEGEILFLYCYSEDADYLPVSSYASVEQVVNLIIKVDNASDVTAQILPETSVIRDNFAANSILKADLDNEPEALIVGEDCVIGRKAGGKIESLSVSEMRKLLSISDFPCRHAIQTLGNGITIDDELVSSKFNEVLSEVGNGASRTIDFGLDFTNNHGMVLLKNKDSVYNWIQASSFFPNSHLQTDSKNALSEDPEYSGEFTSNGLNVGTYGGGNESGSNIAEFAFHCTHEKVRTFENVKSVIFDFADNWGYGGFMGVRSIEFEDLDGNVISLSNSDFTAYATSQYTIEHLPEYTFDTSLSKIGQTETTQWLSAASVYNNQRLIIIFNATQTFRKIIINNSHASGTAFTAGVKSTKVYTSKDAITETTYGATIANSELIFDGQIAVHSASNVIDNKYYCGVHWAYNPATGFFIMTHDGDNGSADFPTKNPMGKRPVFSVTKSIDVESDHVVYSNFTGLGNYLQLDTNSAIVSSGDGYIFKEMSETQLLFGTPYSTPNRYNNAGERYFTWGFVGEDIGYLTPGMMGVERSFALTTLDKTGTFDCGMEENEVQSIIIKSIDATGEWWILNSSSGWDKVLRLNDSAIESGSTTYASWSGSNLTIPSSFGSNQLLILVIGKNGLVATQKEVKGNEVLSEIGNGESKSIDFGLDMTDKHAFFLSKNKDSEQNWFMGSSLLGAGKQLQTNTNSALIDNLNGITGFTNTGIDVGSEPNVNDENCNIAEFGFHCTHEKVRKFENVKSVIFDIENGWGSPHIGFRSIEFEDIAGNIISLTNDEFFAYATSQYTADYDPKNVFNNSLSKTGTRSGKEWLPVIGDNINLRLIIVFNEVKAFKRIIINNSHDSGERTNYGVKNTKIYTSTDSITDTTYGDKISNSEKIFDGQIAQHKTSDFIDDKYYCGVHWAYNPATGFFMLLHDGDSGSADFSITNWTGKDVIWCSTKSVDVGISHIVYNVLTGINTNLLLDSTDALGTTDAFNEMSETQLKFGNNISVNNAGERYFTWGFVGEDLGHITPGMTGIEDSVSLHKLTDGGTFDCGIDESNVQCVIAKRTNSASNWYIKYDQSNWDNELYLNSTNIEVASSHMSFSASNLTLESAFVGDWIVLVIGKNGIMPSGKSINIKADSKNPFIASIADGFGPYGPVDYPVIETSNKQLNLTLEDGTSHLCLDSDGEYSLEKIEPDFESSPGVMRGTQKKLKLGEITVMSGDIVDIDLMAVGDRYETEWFPVEVDTLYELENKFKDTKVDIDIWWSSDASEENIRQVNAHFYQESGSFGIGAYKRISTDNIYIGTGNAHTINSNASGDPISSQDGYYKLIVRREW